jgi:hypothetical protein
MSMINQKMNEVVERLLKKGLAPFAKEKKKTRRGYGLTQAQIKRLQRPYKEPGIKDIAYSVMTEAYMAASANNTLPANARQIMYRVRTLMLKQTDEIWSHSSYFTQTLLPDYINSHPQITANWDVVYDARGHFEEPHTAKRVDLGTLAVRSYVRKWTSEVPEAKVDPIKLALETHGPANRYNFALFIEKEGFNPLLARAQIAEKYDIAIMSTKGMSVTASRQLVEELSDAGVTVLVAHDCDKSGFSICHTLHSDTRRYNFLREPKVICLGLRLDECRAMGLESETVSYSKRASKYRLRECGASEEECAFIIGDGFKGTRIELNAMDSQQFIDWLVRKFEEHGVKKIVPAKDVLESVYRLAKLNQKANEAIARVQDEWGANGHVDIPADLEEQVRNLVAESPEISWDQAVSRVASPDEEEEIIA